MADGGGVERIEPPGGRWSCDSRALTGRSLTWTAAPRVFFRRLARTLSHPSYSRWIMKVPWHGWPMKRSFQYRLQAVNTSCFLPAVKKHLLISGVRRQVMNNQTLLPSAAIKILWVTLYTLLFWDVRCYGIVDIEITIIPGLLFKCSRLAVVARGWWWWLDEIWVDARRFNQVSSRFRQDVGSSAAHPSIFRCAKAALRIKTLAHEEQLHQTFLLNDHAHGGTRCARDEPTS